MDDFFFSDSCGPWMDPYRRLILISSRIPGAKDIASAALNDCALALYDWGHLTLQELLGRVESMLGGHKVDSVAVIAPGGKPGAIGLLQGYQTTRDKLSKKEDLAKFWKRLASHVTPNSGVDGSTGRIDLLSCRVTEAAEKGADLMASLQKLTKLKVFASDDPPHEYPLSQSSKTGDGVNYLSASGFNALGMYFDYGLMLHALNTVPVAINAPTPGQRAGSLAPLGKPPKGAPALAPASQPFQPLPAPAAPQPKQPSTGSPYAELLALAQQDFSGSKAMATKHSTEGDGHLTLETITRFFKELNPSLTNPEFVALLIDLKRSRTYDLDHLLEELRLVEEVYKDNMAGRDAVDVLDRLHDYLSSNKEIMQQVFEQVDQDESGKLDVHELCQLVAMIPGLDVSEVRYILIHLITKRNDLNHGSKLSLDELYAIIR